jgi:hypothetical protein
MRPLYAGVMFISFVHQPLTFPLVYASPWRLATHRRLFLALPAVVVAVIIAASAISMTLVAIVGALWNVEHILMQRYGIARMYGRKAQDDQGGVERWMLVTWFLVPLLWIASTGQLRHVLDHLSSGSVDGDAARLLAKMAPEAGVALAASIGAAVWLTTRWVGGERRPNVAKWLYLASTAALFAVAFVDPVAAVVGFVASHSVEYFVLVDRSVASESRHPGLLGRISSGPHGRLAFLAGYLAVTTAVFWWLYRLAPASVLWVGILSIGALHFSFDAFIWKLRRPLVAESLAVSP